MATAREANDHVAAGAASKTIYDDWEGSDDDFGGV
jgi:hypothetical protein